jgi:flavorubredoxin
MSDNTIARITDEIFLIRANDRTTEKFEGLWPLPHGVAYNAYLIRGKKNILIDTVKNSCGEDLYASLSNLLESARLDYVVVNHMEPDHSGSVKFLRSVYPGVKFIGNAKTADMMKNFFGIEDGVVVVKDGEIMEIDGRKYVFVFAPMVHWPESMVTYDADDKILFSSDIFGGFGATEGGVFDDEADMALVEEESMRYFVNIVGRFAAPASKALAKARGLEVKTLCPSHGPVWRSNPDTIISLYEKWSRQETSSGVVLVYGSMYGNTKKANDEIAAALCENGVKPVRIYDAARCDVSKVITDIWESGGLILSSCTYNMELYPPVASILRFIENKNMKGRRIGICGNHSWADSAFREMSEFVERSKGGWALIEPKISIKSAASAEDMASFRLLAKNMAVALGYKV